MYTSAPPPEDGLPPREPLPPVREYLRAPLRVAGFIAASIIIPPIYFAIPDGLIPLLPFVLIYAIDVYKTARDVCEMKHDMKKLDEKYDVESLR